MVEKVGVIPWVFILMVNFWRLSDNQERQEDEDVICGKAERDKELGAPLFSVWEEREGDFIFGWRRQRG